MAAPTYVSDNGAYASATSVTVTKPASLADGDWLFALWSMKGNPSITPPSGFNLHSTVATGTGGNEPRSRLYSKYVSSAAGEPASYTWSTGSSLQQIAQIVAVRGADPSTPILAYATSNNATGSNTITVAGITMASADVLLLAFYGLSRGNVSGVTQPSGYTEIVEINGGNPHAAGAAYKAYSGSNPAATSFTAGNNSPKSNTWHLALREPVAAATGRSHIVGFIG